MKLLELVFIYIGHKIVVIKTWLEIVITSSNYFRMKYLAEDFL